MYVYTTTINKNMKYTYVYCTCGVTFVNLIIRILHYTLMNDQLLTQQSSATKLALLTDGIIISGQCIMHIPPQ